MTITWWLAAIPDCLRVSCLLRQWWGVTKQTNNYPQGRNNHPLMMTAYDDENGDGRWWWPLEREKKRRGDLSLGLALHIGLWRKSPPHKSNLVSVFVLTLGAVASKEKRGGGPDFKCMILQVWQIVWAVIQVSEETRNSRMFGLAARVTRVNKCHLKLLYHPIWWQLHPGLLQTPISDIAMYWCMTTPI